MLSSAEKREIALAKQRLRGKRYYEKNKEKISQKNKSKSKIPLDVCNMCENQKKEEQEKKKKAQEKEILTESIILEKLNEYKKTLNVNTINTHKSHIKSLFKITKCSSLNECLLDPNFIINLLNTSTYKNKNEEVLFKTNSKIGYMHSLLYVLDNFYPSMDLQIKKKYQDYALLLKTMSENELEISKKNMDKSIISYSTYLNKIKDFFKSDSKEYLLAKLYDEVTCRDNFQLKIVKTIEDTKDLDVNYLIVNENSNAIIVLNKYKTSKNKTSPIVYTTSDDLNNLLKKYISKKNINFGQYLFSDKLNGKFISTMNQKIGLSKDRGINFLRHSKISEICEECDNDPIIMTELSTKMGHSTKTGKDYKRVLENN